ncbi:TetR/AcrR family transcriptional regulator [Pseudonocardiaceae bacterium YIM PH 21723]|nr:TetR/AcrR family transcriptional regulator [Pseudonocardiaceae bacterium YIM PH 21723]
MTDERRERVRLEISREAAKLFWEQGVMATTGEQIAARVGLSVRTLWRHFRTKESCAEPIITFGVDWFVETLRRWPPERSLEDHIDRELRDVPRTRTPEQQADDLLAVRMMTLADREPALRSAWLMACDQLERETASVIGDRLGRSARDIEVRIHAAAAIGVLRVINEDIGADLLAGADPFAKGQLHIRFAHAVHTATGGVVGDPVGEGQHA